MTHEMHTWLSTEGTKKTGEIITFKKGTPTYKLKDEYAGMLGGYPNALWYEKDGGVLPHDFVHEITKEEERFGVITLVEDGGATITRAYNVLLKETKKDTKKWIKISIIATIVIAAFSLIWYKYKH